MTEPAYNYNAERGRCTLADHSTSLGGVPGLHATTSEHAGGHDPHAHNPNLQHHFYSMEQQLEASTLGMWVFLVTEIMFFGGMFMAYIVYRHAVPGGVGPRQPPPERHPGRAEHRRADLQLADDGAGGARRADRVRARARSST